MQYA
ncbi:hypothetical protein ECPA28_3079, partial [Escherichia coli PA28]|jgi:hypothetical protein